MRWTHDPGRQARRLDFSCSSHGYWQINNRGAIVPIKLPRSNNEAIAAHTFSDEERDAIRALAKDRLLLRRYTASGEGEADAALDAWDNADDAVAALPTDVLQRLAQESGE